MKTTLKTILLPLLVFAFFSCEQTETTMMILPKDADLRDEPQARSAFVVLELSAGDTVFALATKYVPIPGSGRKEGDNITWYKVQKGTSFGWLRAGEVALPGDPRLAKINAVALLPPSPKLYRKRQRTLEPGVWQAFLNWCGTTYRRNWGTYEEKTEILIREACDFDSPLVRSYAIGLIPHRDEGSFHLSQLCNIWDHLHEGWTYVNDPHGQEYFASATESIRDTLKGDCDDHFVLLAALVRSIGGDIRLNAISTEKGGHLFAEIHIGDEQTLEAAVAYLKARYHQERIEGIRVDGHGRYFLNLDWMADHVGAPYYDHETLLRVVP